jgi:predicted HicB family RNase H-like nuclease
MAEDVRATTRIPKHIAEWLKLQAKQHHRSMNGQLIECLETLMRSSKSERA